MGAERRRILQDRGDAAVHHNISEENIYDGARAKEQSEEVRRIKQLKALLPRNERPCRILPQFLVHETNKDSEHCELLQNSIS